MPEGDVLTNENGGKVQLINGQWTPINTFGAGSIPQAISDVGDFVGGTGMGLNNIAEFFGREPDPDREAAERQVLSRSPIAASLGEGAVIAGASIPGVIGGEAMAGMMGLRALGTMLMGSIGGGITSAPAIDTPSVGGIAENTLLDVIAGTTINLAGRGPSIANKVVQAIRKGGKFKRDVLPGDLADGGQALVNRIQDADIPLTRSQATGSAQDRITENSLRRDPFQAGPQLQSIDNAQQVAINNLAAESIGLPPGTNFIDAPTLAGAKKNIGDGIEAVANTVGDFQVDPTVVQQFDALADTPFIASTTGTKGLVKISNDMRKRFESGTPITGQEWKDIRENVNAALGSADGPDARVLGRALDIVDDMPPIAPELAEQYGRFREQWRTVLQLEKGATLTPEGNVNVGQLNRNLQNTFGNVVDSPSRTLESQSLREISEAFGTRRMTRTPTSGTAENLQVANQIANASEIVGQAAGGDLTGAAARGTLLGGVNAIANPLFLGPPTDPATEQVLRILGTTGAAALQQEATGQN